MRMVWHLTVSWYSFCLNLLQEIQIDPFSHQPQLNWIPKAKVWKKFFINTNYNYFYLHKFFL